MVIFGTGVVTGGLLVGHFERIHAPRPLRNPPVVRPTQPLSAVGMRREEFLHRAGRELALTPEQRERVDKIIKDSQERTKKVLGPYMREELQRTREQFREVLTPEQRPRFDQMLKQQQQQQQQRAREQRRPQPSGERPAEAPGATPPPPAR
jgi:hypothetical protein